MALESASYVAGLNTANPTASDPIAEGDNHIRLIKSVLKNTFPALTGAITVSETELNATAGATSAFQSQINALVARTISAGTGLTGGGSLSANRTLSADIATLAEAAAGLSDVKLMTPAKVAHQIANTTALVTLTGSQTLTNKTLTSPTITTPTLNGSIIGSSLATALEAQAGLVTDKLMTPDLVRQAILALAPPPTNLTASNLANNPGVGAVVQRNCLNFGSQVASSSSTATATVNIAESAMTALVPCTIRVQFTVTVTQGQADGSGIQILKNGVAVLTRTTSGTNITFDVALAAGDNLGVRIYGRGTSGGGVGACYLNLLQYLLNGRYVIAT